jgi:hypothetical protein
MHRYRVLEQSHTYSTSNTYRYTHIHIHTLRLIPKMGTKVRNRNLRLNHSKTFPIPTKFYQSSSFYILYRMPIKKTPNESRTKNAFRGTVLRAGFGVGWVARPPARTRWFVFLRGSNPKTRVFTPKSQIRPFSIKTKFIQLPYTFNYIL